MSKFYISVTNGFVNSADRDNLCHIIKTRLIAHYGTESAVLDAYMNHWDRLQDGETSAEIGTDLWSDAWNAAQDGLLDGWHSAPDCMFELVVC
jgi:hypothetical protein